MKRIFWIFLTLSLVSSCAHFSRPTTPHSIESAKLKQFFEAEHEAYIKRYPQFATFVNRKEGFDRLDDISEEFTTQEYNLKREELRRLAEIKYTFLNEDEKVSYDYFKYLGDIELEGEKYRYHEFPVNQMFGRHTEVITFLMNRHLIDTKADAQAYIARLKDIRRYFEQLTDSLRVRQAKHIIAPRFAIEKSIVDIKNILSGRPFDESEKECVLLEDFKKKLAASSISEDDRNLLKRDAERALLNFVEPGYKDLLAFLEKQRPLAPKEVAAWSLPDGAKYYDYKIRYNTTSDMSARQIHEYGKKEVSRLHNEIKALMPKLGYGGSDLRGFFKYVKSTPKFFYANNNEGKTQFLRESQEKLDNMQAKLSDVFGILPKAQLIVKPVEAYREKSAGLAFYESPSESGSAPGIYYINLGNMTQANRYEMEALAYHEGMPGHHLQMSIAQEQKDLPAFRRYHWLSAFSEGWGLYAERLGKEMGMYQDPIFDFGRLSMELWRATRLVVDTGIHWKHWSMSEAKKYLRENTAAAEAELQSSVERYLVMPGQATSYKIGMKKILELRDNAKNELGEKFSLREFHDHVLKQGNVPLGLLEIRIQNWIDSKRSSTPNPTTVPVQGGQKASGDSV